MAAFTNRVQHRLRIRASPPSAPVQLIFLPAIRLVEAREFIGAMVAQVKGNLSALLRTFRNEPLEVEDLPEWKTDTTNGEDIKTVRRFNSKTRPQTDRLFFQRSEVTADAYRAVAGLTQAQCSDGRSAVDRC